MAYCYIYIILMNFEWIGVEQDTEAREVLSGVIMIIYVYVWFIKKNVQDTEVIDGTWD